MQPSISLQRRLLLIFSIVFAGEMIFSLPFHVARFFRPTLLGAFDLTNAQLGDIFALYGIMAMLVYFPGGMVADRFSPRRLMSFSLFATALGGLYYAQLPGHEGLAVLFAYWGVTTIFLFWAAMIKVTRMWGGETTQGKAFGVLDGGRGLVAAGAGSIAVFILSLWMPTEQTGMDVNQQREALKAIITFYSMMTLFAAVLVLLAIPRDQSTEKQTPQNNGGLKVFDDVVAVLKQPVVWFQALIVLAAYCAYKGLDYFGLYVTIALGQNDVESAGLVTLASYLRPVAAITAGIIADKLQVGRVVSGCFALLGVSYLLFLLLGGGLTSSTLLIELNILISFLLVFAVRGIYFALLAESKLSGRLTGTAVGLICVVGFTPDIFFAPVAGRILDAAPGIDGFNRLFLLLGCLSVLGLVMAAILAKRVSSTQMGKS